ncbi:hypothetical protein ACFYMO_03855 [Streptomyces sp. NPDC007025]|uniref:hypothetical protein n=1 Tax=Streptomyces sp. NPDC007025 TaxID=3364771 RepID=UPI0036A5599A
MPTAKYVLTIRSRSGKRLPGCTGSSTGIAVYSDTDLKKRLKEAAKDPDLAATYRRAND